MEKTPKKSKTGLKIAISAAFLVTLLCCIFTICGISFGLAKVIIEASREEYCEILEQFYISNDPFDVVDCNNL